MKIFIDMKKVLLLLFFTSIELFFAQTIAEKLDSSVQNLLASSPMFSGNLSFYVADKDGAEVYSYQSNKGLSTASTMKIFTAATALEVLGKNYTYTTQVALNNNLYIKSNGDPSLGSWRYEGRPQLEFISKIIEVLKKKNITHIHGDLILDDLVFDFQKIPGGWPYNDIGNYYGAGVWGINWRENQFDIQTFGRDIKSISLNNYPLKVINEVRTEGTSDKSVLYTYPYGNYLFLNGTLPAKTMTVSGATPNPPKQLAEEIIQELEKQNIKFQGQIIVNSEKLMNGEQTLSFPMDKIILTYNSPPLEKLVYWFLKKSINLYGETFIKTIALEKTGNPTFESGMNYLKTFWEQKGIDPRTINVIDGSGLSPQNYASSKAEVQALLWAKKQPWFTAYYDGFPVQGNGMKMKSGSIKNCRAFAGYHTSSSGKEYTFAIIMNNYQGTDLSDALYKILNNLK